MRGGVSARRLELARKPADGIRLKRIYVQCDFLDAMACAAFERAQLVLSFARRYASQTHPVLAGRTHRSFNAEYWATHSHPHYSQHRRVISETSVRQPTLTNKFVQVRGCFGTLRERPDY